MKKIILATSFACLFIVACKKGDKVRDDSVTIAGVWKADSTRTVEYNGNTVVDDYVIKFTNATIDFKTDGRFLFTYPGEPAEGGTYLYNASAKTLSLKYDTEAAFETGNLLELTARKMVVQAEVNYNPPSFGITREVATLYFSR